MNIKRLTARIWPVAAATSTGTGDHDPDRNSARRNPEHTAAAEPSADTKVTISDAGREACRLDAHIVDERVHVVAAPGSGKTILGLELMRRLGRPTVVLAPTRTICDQWSARLVPRFMTEAPRQEQLSPDLKAPATMTTATYQALHTI